MDGLNNKTVYDKLDAIDSKVDQLLIWRAIHIEAHERIERDVADNRAALFENPGVISRIDKLWNCKSNITEWRKFWLEILKYLVVAAIVAIVTWGFLLFKQGLNPG